MLRWASIDIPSKSIHIMYRADLQLPCIELSKLDDFLILHLLLQACLLSAQKQLSVNTWIAAGHSMVRCSANHHKLFIMMPVCHINHDAEMSCNSACRVLG